MAKRKQESKQKGNEISFEIVGVPESMKVETPVFMEKKSRQESPKVVKQEQPRKVWREPQEKSLKSEVIAEVDDGC